HLKLIIVSLALLLVTTSVLPVAAATLPSGFAETPVASGLTAPTAMAFAPDGRLFVCEQTGRLRVIKNGGLLATAFLTLPVDSNGERGLLGIAFDPNFASNHFVYVYYTATTPAVHNRVSRFTANGDLAVPGSELPILDLNNLSSATNHNGGALHFGPDGKLFIGVGENANGANSQTLNNLLGKILRINSDGSIPTDNPFFTTASDINRVIWAMGLRNPYTFAFQPGTGVMFINDVGENSREEINLGQAGANYGWPTCEGTCSNSAFVNPIFTYAHGNSSTTGCAIVGGAFYNPTVNQFPSGYLGTYFFADLCSGWVRRLDPVQANTVTDFTSGLTQPVDLQISADGNLYYLVRGSGQVFKIQYVAPLIVSQPANLAVNPGQDATFIVNAAGNQPLSFQWQRNGMDIQGATLASLTVPAVSTSDNGAQFRVVVSNSFGTVTSAVATLTVSGAQLDFSQNSFSVGEAGGAVTITVTRSGDLSGNATVDYATMNGTAVETSDFTTNLGSLSFTPGQPSQSFVVLITDDGYVEGNETINLVLSNPSGAALGSGATAQLVITDNDSNPPVNNPADQPDFFVRQHYRDFLNREPDAGGLSYWSQQISFCGSDPQCIRNRRLDVSAAFFTENEFQDTGFFVVRMYRAGLGRRPSFVEFSRDRTRLIAGTNLDLEKQLFSQDFVARLEFSARFPLAQSSAEFVDALISAVRTVSGIDLTIRRGDLINEYSLGANQNDSRARVLRKLIDYAEYRQAEFNGAFVLAQYFGYLRRDADQGGYQFWLNVLNNRVPNNYRSMVCAFITSAEYQRRFSSIVTHSNQDCGP
ncbi:MAG TPA: PQQ-dependent sugar dehydrogenase, partial [Pyrinomonadaceae bacterium]